MSTLRFTALFALLFLSGSLAVAGSAYQVIAVNNGGTIRGTVRWKGNLPALKQMRVSKDPMHCGKAKSNPSLVTGKNGGVQNAVVYIEKILKGKEFAPTPKPPTLDQEKCEYVPHVVVVRTGTQLTIANSDSTLHTVHAYDFNNKSGTGLQTIFNMALPVKGMKIPRPVDRTGVFLNLCDTGHPWMSSYVISTEHPYYSVTDSDGNYVIDRVPPGQFTLKMWHEPIMALDKNTSSNNYVSSKHFEVTKKIIVTTGKTNSVDFEISGDDI